MAEVFKYKNNNYLYGTIIEKGSNNNGNYIKYSDGTIICNTIKNLGNINYTNQYGAVWLDSAGNKAIDYPFTFDNVNDIYSINITLLNIGGGVGGISGSGHTRNQVSFYLWHSIQYTLPTIVSVQVIGKWR